MRLGIAYFLWLCVLAVRVHGQEANVTVDFPGVEMGTFLQWVGVQTGQWFIYEDETLARKKVHIVSNEPIAQEAVFPLCLSVLEANGYTAVLVKGKHADVWKVITTGKAPSKPIPILTTEELNRLEDKELFISQLVILRYLPAAQVLSAIQQAGLIASREGGSAVTMQGTNALLITDFVPNVRRIVALIEKLDQPPSLVTLGELARLEDARLVSLLVTLRYTSATDVLSAIQQAKWVSQQNAVVNMAGTNTLLLTDVVPNVRRMVAMIRQLDQPGPEIVTEAMVLRHAQAGDVGQRVEKFFSQSRPEDKQGPAVQGVAVLADERTNTLLLKGERSKVAQVKQMVQLLDAEVSAQVARPVLKTYRLENTTTAKILPTLNQLIQARILEPSGAKIPAISILSNDYANALVIYAPVEIYAQIIGVIKELDIRQPQVLLEVAVVEFTPTDLLSLGIELQTVDAMSKTQTSRQFAGTQFGLSSLVDQAGEPIKDTGLPDGKTPNTGSGLLTFLTKGKGDSIPILLRALQSTSKTQIHAVPRILTNDNEEAEVVLQDEVPVTQTTVDEGTSVSSFKEFVQAGTQLKLKPHISKGGYLQLEITQKLQAFVGISTIPGTPPARTSRSLQTKVTVPDGQTVILGGLSGRREIQTVDKVPLLGDIPLLGYLFQSRSVQVSQTSLYVFITPKIIDDPGFKDLQDESRRQQQDMHEMQRKLQKE